MNITDGSSGGHGATVTYQAHVYDTLASLASTGVAPERVCIIDAPAGQGWGPDAALAVQLLDVISRVPVGVLALRARDGFGGNPCVAHVLCEVLAARDGILWVDGKFINPDRLLRDEPSLRRLAAAS